MLQENPLPKGLALGPSVIKLKLTTQMLMDVERPAPRVPKKEVPVALPKKVSSFQSVKPVVTESNIESALSQEVREDLKSAFKAELRAEIEKNKYYPPLSRRLGQTGIVVVAFTLLEDGHIIDVRVDSPSRFERLNTSALEAVMKVHKFKPIPREWGDERMDLKVPLNFITI